MPKILKLISLEVEDSQQGGYNLDLIRFIVVLDHRPVRVLKWAQLQNTTRQFTADENFSDEGLTRVVEPFKFWSLADLTVYEADTSGPNSGLDTNLDEWIHTIRLDHPPSRGPTHTVTIGKNNASVYLSNGRSDTRYILTYSLEDVEVHYDPAIIREVDGYDSKSPLLDDSNRSGNFEQDKGSCKWICSIDGGGLRGIFPLRLLEQLERYYGKSCYEMFDMFAGTSTGSIIASMLASGYPLKTIISLYSKPSVRSSLFRDNRAGQHHAFRYLDLRTLGPEAVQNLDDAKYANKILDLVESSVGVVKRMIHGAAEQLIAPRYRKTGMKELLYQFLSNRTEAGLLPYALKECGKDGTYKDILITARDLNRCETTFFTAFHIPYESTDPREDELLLLRLGPGWQQTYPGRKVDLVTGTYRDVFVKDAVEASASAPIFFSPRGQFSDGGIGAHNNPAFMAAIEALVYSHIDTNQDPLPLTPKYTPYTEEGGQKSGTVVWSFGTSYTVPNPDEQADVSLLIGGSQALRKRTDTALHWAERVIDNLMFGANQEQDFLCREVLKDQIKYLRYNVGINRKTLDDLGVSGPRDQILAAIKLDAVPASQFDLMDGVAQQFALFARNSNFGFAQGGYQMTGRGNVPADTYAAVVRQNFRLFE